MQLRKNDALLAIQGSDLLELGMAADAVRREKHPENVVTYALRWQPGRSLEQTTREAVLEGNQEGNAEVVLADLQDIGSLSCDALVTQLQAQQASFPKVTFHHLPFSCLFPGNGRPADVLDVLRRLQDAGVRSIGPSAPNGGHTGSSRDLAPVLHAARTLDMAVNLTLTIGNGESAEQRLRMLTDLHALQEETHAIQVVVVRIHHATTPEARREEEATAVDYLKTLAITRLTLDNVEHIQTEWSVMGPKVLELALRFGADDAGWVPRTQAGPEPSHHGGESELRRIIRDAGFRPVERDARFRQSVLH